MKHLIIVSTVAFFVTSLVIFDLGGLTALAFSSGGAEEPSDTDALRGVKIIKAVYDINGVTEPKKMILFLRAITDARARAVAAKVKPDLVLAFRGPALNLIQRPESDATDEQKQIAELLAELKNGGARLEACNFAVTVLKLDRTHFLPGVKVVANTFNSLAGYQAKGYGIIPVQ